MCGFAGCTWPDPQLVERMAGLIAHRGPDQWGMRVQDSISLAHRRLSIIDLSVGGRQPLSNEDGTLWLVYNGEIYDFASHRRWLQSRGHRFGGHSDGEVILHLYEEEGDRCLERLRGMFAFALWDSRRRRLLLARDRLGIKPLYWAQVDGELIFASELKALLVEPRLRRSVDPHALAHLLGFEMVPEPATLLQGIYKLGPGCKLVWEDGRAVESRWWELSMEPRERPREEHAEALREAVRDAVVSHLTADVPVGLFLSGGLDSSAIAVFMHRAGIRPLVAFSLSYPQASYSELDHAAFMARQLDAEHHVLTIESVTAADLEKAIWHLDEPMTDLSALPFYMLCRRAREQVTVCLSGEGGDEILAGYDRFRASRLHRIYERLPERFRRGAVAPLVGRLPERPAKKGPINLLKRFVAGGLLPEDGGHLRWQYFLPPELARELLAKELCEAAADPFASVRHTRERGPKNDALAAELFVETRYFLPASPLMKVDKLSMAHGLEVRVPLLDHRLVELVAGIPSRHKLRGLRTKAIFRDAMRGVLPERIRSRGKQGYSLPVKHLLRGELSELLADSLSSSPLVRDAFRRPAIERLQREHHEGRANHSHLLWALLNLALWHRQYCEGGSLAPQPLADPAPSLARAV